MVKELFTEMLSFGDVSVSFLSFFLNLNFRMSCAKLKIHVLTNHTLLKGKYEKLIFSFLHIYLGISSYQHTNNTTQSIFCGQPESEIMRPIPKFRFALVISDESTFA